MSFLLAWQRVQEGGMSITIMDYDLLQLIEMISQRTGMPVDQLVGIALWDFVRSIDLNYEELREGAIYRQPAGAALPSA
jgi:hypothetical protein